MAQEFLGPFTGGALEDLLGATVLDDHAVFGEIDDVADLFGKAHFVGHQHAGHAFFGQLANHRQYFTDAPGHLSRHRHGCDRLDALRFLGQRIDPGFAHANGAALGLQQAGDTAQDGRCP
eukprot:gene16722-20083_t